MERALSVENEAYLTNELKTHGLLRAVHEKVRVIAITDIEKVVRRDESTGQPIVAVEQSVARLINMFRILRRCGLELLTAAELAAVLETCLRVNSVFDMIRTFDSGVVTALDAPGTVNQIAGQTDTVAQSAYQILGTIIAKTFFVGEYFTTQMEGAGEHFAKIMSLSQEARETLSDVQRLARYEYSNKFGDSFDREARRHNTTAWCWTTATAAVATGGIVYLAVAQGTLERHGATLSIAKMITLETCHIAIAGFIFYLMVFCARNAASHRHNQVLNHQRRSALSAANAFADSASSDTFKDNVFIQAASAAYDPQTTGFESRSW
jgi:hypothetical protein